MSILYTRGFDSRLTMSRARNLPKPLLRLYLEAFPPEERRPEDELQRRIADGSIELYLIETDGEPVGFITLHRLPSGVGYVEHFAVAEALRGQGAGSAALSLFGALEPGPMVLEVEPAGATVMATRRIGFYRRQGFTLHDDYRYMQPPYAAGLPEVELRLMTRDLPDGYDIHALATEIRRQVYNAPEQTHDC